MLIKAESLTYIDLPANSTNGWADAGHSGLRVYYIVVSGYDYILHYNSSDSKWEKQGLGYSYFANTNVSGIESAIINAFPVYWLDGPLGDPEEPCGAGHTHKWQYGIIYEATEDTDGLEGEYCSCGATRNTSVIPTGTAIINNNYAKIDAAKSGQTIVLEMKTMCTLSNEFMKKIAEKNNCSFTIRFKYNNKLYEVYIPAGTTFDTSLEYYGPECLMGMFEYKQLN